MHQSQNLQVGAKTQNFDQQQTLPRVVNNQSAQTLAHVLQNIHNCVGVLWFVEAEGDQSQKAIAEADQITAGSV